MLKSQAEKLSKEFGVQIVEISVERFAIIIGKDVVSDYVKAVEKIANIFLKKGR
jgi:phosphotransferase system IIB component